MIITFEQDQAYTYPTVNVFVDGEYAGMFQVANEGLGSFRVENVEIVEAFQGKGLYKKLIAAAFEMFGISDLRSDNRNYNSNPIYCHWLGGQHVEKSDPVWIVRNSNGELVFSI